LRKTIPAILPVLLACVMSWCVPIAAQEATIQAEARIKHLNDMKGDNGNVVLWLLPLDKPGIEHPTKAVQYRIEQKNKEFHPHVLAVPVGTAVEFPNEDPFFHNVFSLYKGKKFDLGLYEAGSSRRVVFDKPGVSFIFCNIHPDMNAYILALNTPYLSVSDRKGHLQITEVPFGRYRMHIWYERAEGTELEALSRIIDVASPAMTLGAIDLADSPRFQPKHLNKHGKPYEPEAPPY
jgi:plastocyanin